MTVQELMEELEQVQNKHLQVSFEITDPLNEQEGMNFTIRHVEENEEFREVTLS